MKPRKIHIENQEWSWVVEVGNYNEATEIRIYSSDKKLYRVTPYDIDPEFFVNGMDGQTSTIKPSYIKEYIIKNLL